MVRSSSSTASGSDWSSLMRSSDSGAVAAGVVRRVAWISGDRCLAVSAASFSASATMRLTSFLGGRPFSALERSHQGRH